MPVGSGTGLGPTASRRAGWQLRADWKYDPAFETDVAVSFTEIEPGRTNVELGHCHPELRCATALNAPREPEE